MDAFDHEFRGLFFGEGTIDICRTGHNRGTAKSYYPRVRISMAKWERPMLEAIRDRYGGSISVYAERSVLQWSLTGKQKLRRVCDVLLAAQLPSPKFKEAQLLDEAIELIGPRGTQGDPVKKKRFAEIKEELKDNRFGGRNARHKRTQRTGPSG
jgi:hypothetical protein